MITISRVFLARACLVLSVLAFLSACSADLVSAIAQRAATTAVDTAETINEVVITASDDLFGQIDAQLRIIREEAAAQRETLANLHAYSLVQGGSLLGAGAFAGGASLLRKGSRHEAASSNS